MGADQARYVATVVTFIDAFNAGAVDAALALLADNVVGSDCDYGRQTLITFQTRQANLYGAMGSSGSGTFPAVIRLFAGGRLPAREVITARYPLERVLEAFDRTEERRDGKVLVLA